MPLTTPRRTRREPSAVAARARGVLACPTSADLRSGLDTLALGEDVLSLADDGGRPTLLCTPVAGLLTRAARREVVTLRLTSGVRDRTGARQDDVLEVTGRLVLGGHEDCGHCPEDHRVVTVEPAAVSLTVLGRAVPVPVADFLDSGHALNRGFLQRAVEHANHCHGEELRRAVSRRTGLPAARLVAASLADLDPTGVDLHWVDADGAHRTRLAFGAAATDAAALGRLLRDHLDLELC